MTKDQSEVMMNDVPAVTNGVKEGQKKATTLQLRQSVQLIERGVTENEPRFMTRALRALIQIRRSMSLKLLESGIDQYIQQEGTSHIKSLLVKLITENRAKLLAKETSIKVEDAQPMDGTEDKKTTDGETNSKDILVESNGTPRTRLSDRQIAALPEIGLFLMLLSMMYFLDHHLDGVELSKQCVQYLQTLNRRSLDPLAGRVYFYYVRFHERAHHQEEVRPVLLNAQRTATLRRDQETQATLLNILLHDYIQAHLYDQADRLVKRSVFPEQNVSNSQLVRYHYYLGRIKAVQLHYGESYRYLQQAYLKAPQTASTAGFLQKAYMFSVLVQLLIGEIPDRAIFRQPLLQRSLKPYFELTQVVRVGDLVRFQQVMSTHMQQFQRDDTWTLILRLRHNVIKTGLRMINLAYAKISIDDICKKLHLESREDAEYIIAKAIRDGVIEATLNHEEGTLKSKEMVDVYATQEPVNMFHQRINFCLDLYNESVMALRFPKTSLRELLETPEQRKLREQSEKEFYLDMSDDF